MNITQLLHQWHDGESQAFDDLVDLIYTELHSCAHAMMRRESNGHTLQASALVNESYLRLVELQHIEWQGRQHFFAVAARVMRRILVDHARAQRSQKRGGDVMHVTYDEQTARRGTCRHDRIVLIALNDALNELSTHDSMQATIIELRFFTGLSLDEIAIHLSISTSSVKRKWKLAQAWLYRELCVD